VVGFAAQRRPKRGRRLRRAASGFSAGQGNSADYHIISSAGAWH
jgi:hypothetical protein